MKNTFVRKYKLTILIFIFLLIVVVFLVNKDINKKVVITKKTLTYDNLPKSFDNYKILQISDLHSKEFGEKNKDLIDAIDKIKPDVIMVTGDMFSVTDIGPNTDETDLVAYQLLSHLAKDYKIIYVTGNHEEGCDTAHVIENYYDRKLKKGDAFSRYVLDLQDKGVIFVSNNEYNLYKNNEYIKIYGVYYYSAEINEYIDGISLDKNKFNIILCHDPKYFEKYANMGFNLMLSGHIHGGVIRLPLVGGILDPEIKLFPKYDKGIYKEGNAYMNVSAGLGDSSIKRFLNPPEINVITLKQK